MIAVAAVSALVWVLGVLAVRYALTRDAAPYKAVSKRRASGTRWGQR